MAASQIDLYVNINVYYPVRMNYATKILMAIDPCEMSHTGLLSSSVELEVGLHEFVHHYLNR